MFGQFVSFGNLVPPFPIGVAAIFFFLQSHYIGMSRSQSFSFTCGCNRWRRQPCCITSCTVGGSTRNGLTSICSCGEMATLRIERTPKNIYFCVNNKLVLIFGLLIYRVVVPIMWAATFSNGGIDEKDVIIMTQRRQINNLEKSMKVAEKRLQLVIEFTCVVIVLFVLSSCVIF